MPARRANQPLSLHLLPDLSKYLPLRARTFGITASGLLSILVWNDTIEPDLSLRALPASSKLARAPIGCTLRAAQRKQAKTRARAQKLSLNAYLEALVARDFRSPELPLTILRLG